MAVRRPLPRPYLKQELERITNALNDHDVQAALAIADRIVRLEPGDVEAIASAAEQ